MLDSKSQRLGGSRPCPLPPEICTWICPQDPPNSFICICAQFHLESRQLVQTQQDGALVVSSFNCSDHDFSRLASMLRPDLLIDDDVLDQLLSKRLEVDPGALRERENVVLNKANLALVPASTRIVAESLLEGIVDLLEEAEVPLDELFIRRGKSVSKSRGIGKDRYKRKDSHSPTPA